MNEVMNDARASLARWADERAILDGWFSETWLMERELLSREKSGYGTITRLSDTMFAFQFMEGAKLELEIIGELVMERINHSPDGYQFQVRTLGHNPWMLLKPHDSSATTEDLADQTPKYVP